jgi:hypothetical protein
MGPAGTADRGGGQFIKSSRAAMVYSGTRPGHTRESHANEFGADLFPGSNKVAPTCLTDARSLLLTLADDSHCFGVMEQPDEAKEIPMPRDPARASIVIGFHPTIEGRVDHRE